MEKSTHNFSFEIEYDELTNFIEAINANIDIPFTSINNLNGKSGESVYKIKDLVCKRYKDIYMNFPNLWEILRKDVRLCRPISYTPHTTGYDFRLNPIDITNSIFEKMGYEERIPFINLDNEIGQKYFKDYAYSFFNNIIKTEKDNDKKTIIKELKKNFDKICDAYEEPLDIRDLVVPKDTLFFLAFRSLDLYESTKDTRYLIFAKEYYDYVSHMRTSSYPHSIYRSSNGEKVWYGEFRKEFEDNVPEDTDFSTKNILLSDDELFVAWEILKPGEVEKNITNIVKRARQGASVNYKKYQELFEKKMNFYINSPYTKPIMGLYGLDGYMGFAYKNEYLLFDKFYNSDTKDPTRRTILTHGEAIYALPSDRFEFLNRSTKQDIIKEKEIDTRIKKLNHSKKFLPRVQGIIDGKNVSKSTLDVEIEKAKKKRVLVLG